jgi:hypothetical protein
MLKGPAWATLMLLLHEGETVNPSQYEAAQTASTAVICMSVSSLKVNRSVVMEGDW